MTMNREPMYWHTNSEWYIINDLGEFELTERATPRARASFAMFLELQKNKRR